MEVIWLLRSTKPKYKLCRTIDAAKLVLLFDANTLWMHDKWKYEQQAMWNPEVNKHPNQHHWRDRKNAKEKRKTDPVYSKQVRKYTGCQTFLLLHHEYNDKLADSFVHVFASTGRAEQQNLTSAHLCSTSKMTGSFSTPAQGKISFPTDWTSKNCASRLKQHPDSQHVKKLSRYQ